jgi:hypothetical protein
VNCFYRRTVKSGSCTNTSPGSGADGHINVNNFPTKADSITPTPTAAYCNGGTGIKVGVTNTILGNGTDYTTSYELYRDGLAPAWWWLEIMAPLYFAPNQTIAGTYTVLETITLTSGLSNSCGSTFTTNSLILTIDANVQPDPVSAGSNQTVCDSAIMAAQAAIVGTGAWSVVSGSGTFTTPSSPTTSVTSLATGVNTYKWKLTNGTCADSNTVVITANKSTIAPASLAAAPATFCNGGGGTDLRRVVEHLARVRAGNGIQMQHIQRWWAHQCG